MLRRRTHIDLFFDRETGWLEFLDMASNWFADGSLFVPLGAVAYAGLGHLLRRSGLLERLLLIERASSSLGVEGRERAVLYVLSTVHAAAMTSYAVADIRRVWQSEPRRQEDESALEYLQRVARGLMRSESNVVHGLWALNFTTGYMLHDCLATVADWSKYKDQTVHHLLTLGTLSASWQLASNAQLRGYAGLSPLFFVVDASTIFLNLMWLLRSAGRTNTRLYKFCVVAFILLFFLLRLVHAPNLVFNVLFKLPHIGSLLGGFMKPLFLLALALQFYWALQILSGIKKLLTGQP